MQEHFNFTDQEFKGLMDSGVTVAHLFKFARDFDIGDNMASPSFITLFYYVDKKGCFQGKPDFPSKKICRAIFEKLTIKQKINISEYISDKEDKEF